ncbi:MAG: hypothetical protein QXU20_02040 [Candidatus Woesearchaeota archaeon]
MKRFVFILLIIASFFIGLLLGVVFRGHSLNSQMDFIQNNENSKKNYYDNISTTCDINKTCSETLSPVNIDDNENSNIVIIKDSLKNLKGPSDRIKENQIQVFNDKVIIYLQNPEWASFTPTGSMEPVLNEYANAIQIVPKSEEEIKVGDIISYESEYADGIIIHRVIDIGYDKYGWYCIAKGDNNPKKDPGKIRFSQIKRVLVAIIY